MIETSEYLRILGESTTAWASKIDIGTGYWVALSGQRSVDYNLACCYVNDKNVLDERCLTPLLAQRLPGIVLLGGAGLGAARPLINEGWVPVGYTPLMYLPAPYYTQLERDPLEGYERLGEDDIPAILDIMDRTLDVSPKAGAEIVRDDNVKHLWGVREGKKLVSCVTVGLEDKVACIWSMATHPDYQSKGYGKRLLQGVLWEYFARGAQGSLLYSSLPGQRLYQSLSYRTVDHLQLWSKPRWVIA
jgi:GNAT superfamily N-acetyltransferase